MEPKIIDTVEERRIEKKEFAKKFGNYLRKIRGNNISQEELALRAGFSRSYIGKIEQGNYSPSLHTIWRISHALNLKLPQFLKGFDD